MIDYQIITDRRTKLPLEVASRLSFLSSCSMKEEVGMRVRGDVNARRPMILPVPGIEKASLVMDQT